MRDSCEHDGPPWHQPRGRRWRTGDERFLIMRRRRTWFFRRLAFGVFALFSLTIVSMAVAAWLMAGRFGSAGAIGAFSLLLLLFALSQLAVFVSGSMRGFASPLHAVMDAADRVADGDYAVRVQEYGAPPMRALAHSFNTMTERLQNADRLRRNVMADVAHELRTPLSVLQGRLEGLIDGVYPRDDRQLSELLEETHVLSRLIEDLRTLALSDAGALRLEKEPTNLVDLVKEVVRSMQPEADQKDVPLRTSSTSDTIMIDLDRVRIREVLTNLLSNALRHTAAGRPVNASVEEKHRSAVVIVRDEGEGMSAEEVARMFDRFYKGDSSRGSGLGLSIVKSIVTAHGGDIRVSSELGKGTTIAFEVPR